MTQQADAGSLPAVEPVAPTRAMRARPVRRRGERTQTVVTGLLVLVLLAGDLLVALQLPVRESTCTDRLCGPALGVAAGAVGAGATAVVAWLVGDRRRERGRGTWLCWAALLLAALPWGFVALHLQWW